MKLGCVVFGDMRADRKTDALITTLPTLPGGEVINMRTIIYCCLSTYAYYRRDVTYIYVLLLAADILRVGVCNGGSD